MNARAKQKIIQNTLHKKQYQHNYSRWNSSKWKRIPCKKYRRRQNGAKKKNQKYAKKNVKNIPPKKMKKHMTKKMFWGGRNAKATVQTVHFFASKYLRRRPSRKTKNTTKKIKTSLVHQLNSETRLRNAHQTNEKKSEREAATNTQKKKNGSVPRSTAEKTSQRLIHTWYWSIAWRTR